MRNTSQFPLAALIAASLLATAAPATAQYFNYNPYAHRGYGYGNAYGGGGYGSYYGRAGGYLMGASSFVNSTGQLQLDTEKAILLKEKGRQAKIQTRRMNFDEYRYEQSLTPTQEEKHQAGIQQQLQRSRNDPPLTEIWSGRSLNDLLGDLQKMSGSGAYVPAAQIDPDILKQINVTTGTTTAGGTPMLRSGKLTWPFQLQGKEFASERGKIDPLFANAVQQAQAGAVDADTLQNLIDSTKQLETHLRSNIAQISSTDYIRAKRFVTELNDSAKVLQDPKVGNYFSKWRAKGKDVAELVQYMTTQGLQFAPATTGDQAAYTALHRAMANYDMAMSTQVRGSQLTSASGNLYAPPTQP